MFAGWVDHRTTGMTADVTGRGHGVISIRVGRVRVYLQDRPALDSWLDAFREAEDLADAVYGPVLPPPAYRAQGVAGAPLGLDERVES